MERIEKWMVLIGIHILFRWVLKLKSESELHTQQSNDFFFDSCENDRLEGTYQE